MTCIGDSGGALMCQGFLFGITSHGYNYYPGMSNLRPECGDDRVQARLLFIYTYRNWIEGIILSGSSSVLKCNHLTFFLLVLLLGLYHRYYIFK